MKKKILLGMAVVLIICQFIRPQKNIGEIYGENDVTKLISTSEDVKNLLNTACMDCHSNNTVYPFYAEIAPASWWLKSHIDDGKKHLNFSDFKTYPLKRQDHKLEEVIEMIEQNEMPLPSYTWIHRNAILNETQKSLLINWAKEGRKELNYLGEIK